MKSFLKSADELQRTGYTANSHIISPGQANPNQQAEKCPGLRNGVFTVIQYKGLVLSRKQGLALSAELRVKPNTPWATQAEKGKRRRRLGDHSRGGDSAGKTWLFVLPDDQKDSCSGNAGTSSPSPNLTEDPTFTRSQSGTEKISSL